LKFYSWLISKEAGVIWDGDSARL